MRPITRELGQFAADTTWDDLPEPIVREAKCLLLDHVGCALGGQTTERGATSTALATRLGGDGASVLGASGSASVDHATFANAELMTALDYSGIVAGGHDGVYVIPTPLAVAEAEGASGRDLIRAIAVGHEISARLGRALGKHNVTSEAVRRHRERGPSDPTGNAYSNFGAAAGAGLLLGLDGEAMTHALGMAGHLTQILHYNRWNHVQNPVMSKYATPGWQQTGAVTAALLAEMGYVGDTTVLDDPDHGFAYMAGYDHWDPSEIATDLGEEWCFHRRLHYKPYPCCGFFHAALDCFYAVLDDHDLEPDEITGVTAYLAREWPDFPSEGIVGAQFDPGHAFGCAAHGVPRGPQWYAEETLNDPSIRAFRERLTTDVYPGYYDELEEEPVRAPSRVAVEARGETFTEETHYRRGTTGSGRRLTTDDLAEKFRRNAEPVLSDEETERAIDLLLDLEAVDDVTALVDAVTL